MFSGPGTGISQAARLTKLGAKVVKIERRAETLLVRGPGWYESTLLRANGYCVWIFENSRAAPKLDQMLADADLYWHRFGHRQCIGWASTGKIHYRHPSVLCFFFFFFFRIIGYGAPLESVRATI